MKISKAIILGLLTLSLTGCNYEDTAPDREVEAIQTFETDEYDAAKDFVEAEDTHTYDEESDVEKVYETEDAKVEENEDEYIKLEETAEAEDPVEYDEVIEEVVEASFVNVTEATVTRVIDGDTLELSDGSRVRLIGVDTPERGEAGFESATEFTRSRAEGRTVWLEADGRNESHGRLRRYVWLEKPTDTTCSEQIREKMLNAKLLKNGHAEVMIVGNVRNEALFRGLER